MRGAEILDVEEGGGNLLEDRLKDWSRAIRRKGLFNCRVARAGMRKQWVMFSLFCRTAIGYAAIGVHASAAAYFHGIIFIDIYHGLTGSLSKKPLMNNRGEREHITD